jgi:hypothetical protein
MCLPLYNLSGNFAKIEETLLYFKKVRNGILARKIQKNARFRQKLVLKCYFA